MKPTRFDIMLAVALQCGRMGRITRGRVYVCTLVAGRVTLQAVGKLP